MRIKFSTTMSTTKQMTRLYSTTPEKYLYSTHKIKITRGKDYYSYSQRVKHFIRFSIFYLGKLLVNTI